MARQGKGNITKFRQDKRLAVVGALRSLALIGLLATVVFCIYQYREDINIKNLSRIAAYLGSAGRSGEFSSYPFEAGLDSVYAPFEAGLAVLGGNTYRYVTALPEGDFTAQVKAARPAVSVGRKHVLLYDRGGKSFTVANGYTVLHEETLESPILSAEMNQNGDFCIVTDENGYRAAVAMYDSRQNQLYKWFTSDYFVMLASPAPDGKHFAALCVCEQDGTAAFTVRGYAVTQEEPVFTITLSSQAVYSIKHNARGDLVLICDDGVYTYDDKGQPLEQNTFARGSLQLFSHHQGEMPALALQSDGAGEQVTLRILDDAGGIAFERSYSGSLRALDGHGGNYALLFQSRLVTLDLTGAEPVEHITEVSGARDVVTRANGRHILIYSDRAELVVPEEETQS